MRTRPMSLVAAGVALAAIDLRARGVDAAPDLVGWGLVAFGAWRLQQRLPTALASVAAMASIADLALPYRIELLDRSTGEVVEGTRPGITYGERLVYDRLGGPRVALMVAALVAGAAALWFLLRTLQRRAGVTGDDSAARRLGLLRWFVLAAWATPYAVVASIQALGGEGFDPVWNDALELVALPGVLVAIALTVTLALNSNRGWTATDEQRLSPWSELMTKDL